MQRQTGFTLLEILIVIVIASSVLVFALPAYKRAQDKNQYLAAQGVLVDVGMAIQLFDADRIASGDVSRLASYHVAPIQITPQYQDDKNAAYKTAATTDIEKLTLGGYQRGVYGLFAKGYLQPIIFDDSGSTIQGYRLYLCAAPYPSFGTSHNLCCGSSSDVLACIQDTRTSTRASGGMYYGARFYSDGRIEQISK